MKTYEDVRQILAMIEPTEEMYTRLDKEDLPHLQRLMHDPEPWRAARAVHAASRIGTLAAEGLVRSAVTDSRREVRSAAAQAAQRLAPAVANEVLEQLIDDPDLSIKKLAIKSVGPNASPGLVEKLRSLADGGLHPDIKLLAGKQLRAVL